MCNLIEINSRRCISRFFLLMEAMLDTDRYVVVPSTVTHSKSDLSSPVAAAAAASGHHDASRSRGPTDAMFLRRAAKSV